METLRLRACATLAGDPVVNPAGVELGVLEHVMLDVDGGRIAYAVLARGGVFGIGERLYAVPWNAIRRDVQSECFVVDIDPESLDAAPSFDRHHWPSMDAEWMDRVHSHFARVSGRDHGGTRQGMETV
jgi:sporulation protein YlmC with PRC-barrel domain